MEGIVLEGQVGGFLRVYKTLVFELSHTPNRIFVETALGRMNLFLLGEEYPFLEEEDAKLLGYERGIKYHLPKGSFSLDRSLLLEGTKAIALQGLDLLNLFWIDVA